MKKQEINNAHIERRDKPLINEEKCNTSNAGAPTLKPQANWSSTSLGRSHHHYTDKLLLHARRANITIFHLRLHVEINTNKS